MTEQEFEQAVARIRDGDKDGLKEIYLAYVKFIYAVIYEILQNKENTEDVTSEFFIKLWDVAERYEPGRGHRGYLATIARNMAIDYIRKHRREVLSADPDLVGGGGGSTGSVFDTQRDSLSDEGGSAFDRSGGGDGGFGTPSGRAEKSGGGDGVFAASSGGLEASDSANSAFTHQNGGEEESGDGGRSAGSSAHSRVGARGSGGMFQGGISANPVEDEVIGNIALKEVLSLLKDGERQIINMKILGEMTFQEISDTLQMPMGTVTWKYRNAIGKLRRCGYEQGFETRI